MGDLYVASVERNGFSRLVQVHDQRRHEPHPERSDVDRGRASVAGVDALDARLCEVDIGDGDQRWAERFVEPVDSMRYLLSSRFLLPS